MSRLIFVFVAAAMMSGCVSTKIVPLKELDVAALQGSRIALTQREKPSFAAMTAGKAMFGAIGGAAMVVAGNNVVKDNAIDDPAVYIGNELIKSFAEANALSITSTNGALATSSAPKELAKQYPDTDVLLDVQTINWSFVYFPTDFNNYRVIYSAKVRVIDVKKSKLLAEGFCSRVPEKTDAAPSYDELLADQAARLKQELRIGADHCVNEIRAKVLLLPDVRTANSTP